MSRRSSIRIALTIALSSTGLVAALGVTGPASANSDTVNGSPLSCTTSPDLGNQVASWTSTVSDDHDPAAVGDQVTYRFVVPFAQDPPPVTARYRGGTVNYKIPAGFSVSSVTTEAPPGGSPVSSTAAVQGPDVVVTSTADIPMDGTTYPTPDLVVTGTVQQAAAGPGVAWVVPHLVVANVFVNGFGTVTATCTPDAPTTVIGKTVVPGANQPPTANDRTIGVPTGTATSVALTGSDPDGDPLTFSVQAQPSHGNLSGSAPSLTYTPASGFTGTDSFTFQVADGRGGTDDGTITLNVFAGAVVDQTPPTIALAAPAFGAVYRPSDGVVAAFTCSDSTTVVTSCTATVPNGALIDLRVGLHTFTVKAVDSQGNRAQQLVSYRVIDPTPVAQHYQGVAADTVGIECDAQLPPPPTEIPRGVSAPTQVPVGGSFDERAALGQQRVPLLLSWTNLRYTFSAPVGATVTGAQVVPGTGSANAVAGASASVVAGRAVLSLPGPISGGTASSTAFTPPAVVITMTATGAPATTARTGFEQFVVTRSGAGSPPVPPTPVPVPPPTQTITCPASAPAPVTSRTRIIDVAPPLVVLAAPAHGAVYTAGQRVTVSFACGDVEGPVASCTAPVANGSQLPTTSAGTKSFTVDATDAAGNTAQTFASYVVVPTTVTYTAHVDSTFYALMQAVGARFGIPVQDVPKAGVGLLMYLRALDPGANPTPITPAPANTGPIAVPSTYPYGAKQTIDDLAAFYSVTPDQLHLVGAQLLVFLNLLAGG